MNNRKVAHVTSVHPRLDTRIFLKQCRSLAAAGLDVTLIVADGRGDEQVDGVRIVDVGKERSRVRRFLISTRRILDCCIELDAEVYHLHDPELLTICRSLRRAGKAVVFDSHEDLPAQILGKSYLHPMLRKTIAKAASLYESRVCPHASAVVTATPYIRDKFLPINPMSIDVNNYAMLDELGPQSTDTDRRANQVCYIGGISKARGVLEVVRSFSHVQGQTRLKLCGPFGEARVREQATQLDGWERVDETGWLSREEMREVLQESVAGLVTFLPLANHVNAQPNKIFEYMSASVPVIASDFPLWREIVQENRCGICVDPESPKAIAEAIDQLISDPDMAREMGENGRRAVEQKYNWRMEEKKLIKLYQELL